MIGGCLEYLSLLIGYQWLIGVAAVIYLLAVVVGSRTLGKQAVGS
jgi:muramoyltetrapeptide carboxypeptidase LdcA involved in peptidoglycan recycling